MKTVLLIGLALLIAMPAAALAQTSATDADRALLQGVGLKTEGPALLDYFRQRTFKQPDPAELARLLKQLGSDSFALRDQAQQDLLKMGLAVIAGLKQAEEHPDTEVRVRAKDICDQIQAKVNPAIQAATARLIAADKPNGAAAVLLGYIPFATDPKVIDELCSAVAAVALKNGKPEAVVIQSLTDAEPFKRIAAAEALTHGKVKDQYPAIRKLLKDPDDHVRMRAGLALIGVKDREAVPVLVELLGSPRLERPWQIEDVLLRLAGDKAPMVSLGTTDETRKKCRDAWHEWLTKQGDKIDLAKLDQVPATLGYTLIVQVNQNAMIGGRFRGNEGEIVEMDAKQKKLWGFQVGGPNGPATIALDAAVVREGRVLVAEANGARVTERDFKGAIKWEQNVGNTPIGVQAMPNGNVFVVTQNRLVEYDRDHKEVFTLQATNGLFNRARKLRNGDVVYITNTGQLTRIEPVKLSVVKSFPVARINMPYGSFDVLPDGGVLVPDYQSSRVVEYDADGKQRKEFRAGLQLPTSAQRLPNGHTLVGCMHLNRVVELDGNGVEVNVIRTPGMVYNVHGR